MSGRGLVALGDSITNGHGDQALGVHCQSWAQWLAEALDLPFTKLAVDGERAPGLLRSALPRLGDGYDVGALYVGVNDVRSPEWDPAVYGAALDVLLGTLTARAERVVVCTVPLDLGRPRAGAKVGELNAIVRSAAARHGAVVASLDGLRGWRLLLPDAVHPTAVGQLAIADAAAAALDVGVRPSSLASVRVGAFEVAHYALTRRAALVVRDARRRGVEAARRAWEERPGATGA